MPRSNGATRLFGHGVYLPEKDKYQLEIDGALVRRMAGKRLSIVRIVEPVYHRSPVTLEQNLTSNRALIIEFKED